MAIVVEEQRSSGGFLNMLAWIAVLLVLAITVFYVFFKKPELAEVVLPADLKDVSQFSTIEKNQLDPNDIKNNPKFELRRNAVPAPRIDNVGRANPFLPF